MTGVETGRKFRWDPCIAHRGEEVNKFVARYFAQRDRKVFLVVGAGFDPRSRIVAARLSDADASVRGLFIRENRPDPPRVQLDWANANEEALHAMFDEVRVEQIEIFGSDRAVVGGRNIISAIRRQDLSGVTDVIVDVSALSTGTSFPLIRYFVERIAVGAEAANLHVFVVHEPRLDADIRSITSDEPGYVHGFKGSSGLSGMTDAARLWLPQLAAGGNVALRRLYDFLEPHDTCPILPFPATDPQLGDKLVERYRVEIEDTWSVDPRNIVYADEGDPLDLYRTVLRLDDLREPVFAETGGSMLVLSPLGSKVTALGALMAALDRNLAVAYLESIGYELEDPVPEEIENPNLMHIWLEGDVYPQPRPILRHAGSATE